jgi:hypothetical protein
MRATGQHPNGADAPPVSCHHASAARGSFGTLGRHRLEDMPMVYRVLLWTVALSDAVVLAQTVDGEIAGRINDRSAGCGWDWCGGEHRSRGRDCAVHSTLVEEAITRSGSLRLTLHEALDRFGRCAALRGPSV